MTDAPRMLDGHQACGIAKGPSLSSRFRGVAAAALVWFLLVALPARAQCPPTWIQRVVSAPGARTLIGMVYDQSRGQSLVFGGYGTSSVLLSDTWAWNGTAWSQLATTGPSARYSYALAYNTATGNTLLFGGDAGGSAGAGLRNDTWEWNGTAWSSRGSGGPAARALVRMAYDPIRARTVLFGGVRYSAGLVPNGDTWEWDGLSWTQRATTGPTARYDHAMVFDPNRGRVIMFGGYDVSNQYKGDTWEWDGATWTLLSSTGPPARYRHALAFDSGRSRVILFGGGNSSQLFNDTWEWNGTAWTQLAPSTSPTTRRGHGMTYDAARFRCVVFGGDRNSPTSPLAETWELTLSAPPSITQQPGPVEACPTDNAQFTILSGGTGPLAYRWQIESTPTGSDVWGDLFDGPIPGSSSVASDAATPLLTIHNPDAAAARRYRCLVSNACGVTPSNPAGLTLGAACACSSADLASEGNPDPLAGPDGFVTGVDFDVFVVAYFKELRRADNSLIADLTDGTGAGGPDGFVTGTDFDFFVLRFFAGC